MAIGGDECRYMKRSSAVACRDRAVLPICLVWTAGIPVPRVYPTRPVPAGTGRVGYMLHGYGLGRVDALRVWVYPFLPVKNNKMCIATLQVVVKVRHT